MKRLVLLFISAYLLTGCSTLRMPVQQYSSSIDYSKYLEKGFFITETKSVSFEYKPIASVYSVFKTGYEISNKQPSGNKDDVFTGATPAVKTTNRIVSATISGVVEELYNKARSIGANGIVGLEIRNVNEGTGIIGSGYEASGMAIKR